MGGRAEITEIPAGGGPVDREDPMLKDFVEDDKLPSFFEEPTKEVELEQEAEDGAEEEPEEEPDEEAEEGEEGDDDAGEDDDEVEEEQPETLTALLGLVNDLRSELAELKAGTKPPTQEQADPVAAIQPIQPKEVEVSISEEDFDELSSTKEGAQKVLSREVNKAVRSATAQAQEAVYQQLPGLILTQVAHYGALLDAGKKWESENPDLVALRAKSQTVAQMLMTEGNRVQNENPRLSPQQIFDRAGKNVRTMLKELQAKAGDDDKKAPPDKKPKAKGGGAKPAPKPKSKLSDAERELLSDLRPGFR